MPRPCKKRRILCNSRNCSFIPQDRNSDILETVHLTLDELEAIRLADYDGLYQEQAAENMQVSRQTFGNIISSAHKKIADFLVNSKQLTIQGGSVETETCSFMCGNCKHHWSIFCGDQLLSTCPKCSSNEIYCAKKSTENQNIKCWRL